MSAPLLDAIMAATTSTRVRLAMIFGALEEGGSITGPWAEGDVAIGGSYGPYQIYMKAHPGVTPAQANDPRFAVHFMLHEYETAVANVPAGLWNTDPAKAVELATYHAERPSVTYSASRGDKQVRGAYARAVKILQGVGGSYDDVPAPIVAPPPGAGGTSPAAGPGGVTTAGLSLPGVLDPMGLLGNLSSNAAKDLLKIVPPLFGASDIKDLVERAALIVLGAVLVIVGLVMFTRADQIVSGTVGPARAADDATRAAAATAE